MIIMSHDEVLETIPVMFVCETREGARWNSGTRRRLWNEQFTKQEQAACASLFKMAHDWALIRGVPDVVRMDQGTYWLWIKLGEFCEML